MHLQSHVSQGDFHTNKNNIVITVPAEHSEESEFAIYSPTKCHQSINKIVCKIVNNYLDAYYQ